METDFFFSEGFGNSVDEFNSLYRTEKKKSAQHWMFFASLDNSERFGWKILPFEKIPKTHTLK